MPETPWICAGCAREIKTKGARMPKGWKRLGEELLCMACVKSRYILRAITLPIAKPLDLDWPDLRALMLPMWAATTQASNWVLTQLYARDVRMLPGSDHRHLWLLRERVDNESRGFRACSLTD